MASEKITEKDYMEILGFPIFFLPSSNPLGYPIHHIF
jgi:hypothetical protein